MSTEPSERKSFEGEITNKQYNSNWRSNPWMRELFSISIIILAIFVLRSSVFNFYVIPTGSMIPTIKINDRVFSNKLAYGLMLPFMEVQIFSWAKPQRGDIILFQSPRDETTFVKRVIGLENDKISFIDGRLVINDKPVEEVEQSDKAIMADQDSTTFSDRILFIEKGLGSRDNDGHLMVRGVYGGETFRNRSVYVVPPGKVFCMGDNRDGSSDSRIWGFVDADKVYGKALFVIWSTKDPKVDGSDSLLPSFRFERFFSPLQ